MHNLIILGSGRSGTSMAIGAFSQSGFYLGEKAEYLRKNQANPKGFFEDLEVNTINEDILKKTLFNFPEKLRRRLFPSYTFYRARWLARIPLFAKIESDAEIDRRIQKMVSQQPFCYKDPRFSYTLPVWQKYLNENTRYIIVYRHPLLTAQSIIRECRESRGLNKLKMNENTALKVWKYMYRHILENYRNSDKKEHWKFIHFDQFFEVKKVEEIEKFAGAKIEKGFAERKISRSKSDRKIKQPAIAGLYSQLNKLAHYTPHY